MGNWNTVETGEIKNMGWKLGEHVPCLDLFQGSSLSLNPQGSDDERAAGGPGPRPRARENEAHGMPRWLANEKIQTGWPVELTSE
eukprot:3801979-Pyramimonas_sp.AAC.1